MQYVPLLDCFLTLGALLSFYIGHYFTVKLIIFTIKIFWARFVMIYLWKKKNSNSASVLSHCISLLVGVCFEVCIGEDVQLREK